MNLLLRSQEIGTTLRAIYVSQKLSSNLVLLIIVNDLIKDLVGQYQQY